MIDLKGSEKLFRLGAEEGDPNKWIGTCLSHMLSCIISNKGTVLQTDGDGLTAFFDVTSSESPMLDAFKAVESIQSEFNIIESYFTQDDQDIDISLRFRASMRTGEVKPTWQKYGEEVRASWQEAGNGNVFVDTARLMEIERKLENAGTDSNVVLLDEDASSVLSKRPDLQDKIVCSNTEFEGKHGHKYSCTAFTLDEKDEEERLAS